MQGESPRAPSMVVVLAIGLATASCGPSIVAQDDSEEGTGATAGAQTETGAVTNASADETTVSMPSTTSMPPPPGTTVAVDESTSDMTADTGVMSFVVYGAGDGGATIFECDLFAQDCADGEKCMPWANDGGPVHNATRCSPVFRPSAAPGESCTVEGSGVSGLDDCELGVMCYGVDPTTNEGRCVELCNGSEAAPSCDTTGATCIFVAQLPIPMCLVACDPLAPVCGTGETCVVIDADDTDSARCTPWSSAALIGDACDTIDACEIGALCASADQVPGCIGDGCCVPYCDTTDPDADATCDATVLGTVCTPVFPPAAMSPVGACTSP